MPYALAQGPGVADLDSGIDPYHPDLAPNIDFAVSRSFALDWMWVPDVGWIPPEPFIDDLDGHGTWTAGIIAAADNEYGVIGVAPEATIIAVKVLNQTGAGFFSWIINGIVYAATEADADVINMSLGGAFPWIKSNIKMQISKLHIKMQKYFRLFFKLYPARFRRNRFFPLRASF